MPINSIYLAKLEPEQYYHVYNRTNNQDFLFWSNENRRYFLAQFHKYLSHFLEVYSWCLLSNHFHLQIKMKSEEEVRDYLMKMSLSERTKTENNYLEGTVPFYSLANKSFTRFFQSYAQSLNNHTKRKGNLFYKSFKRVAILNDQQFRKTMLYIHTNPLKHGIIGNFRNHDWSSWKEYADGILPKDHKLKTYEIFGNKQSFLMAHETYEELLINSNMLYKNI